MINNQLLVSLSSILILRRYSRGIFLLAQQQTNPFKTKKELKNDLLKAINNNSETLNTELALEAIKTLN